MWNNSNRHQFTTSCFFRDLYFSFLLLPTPQKSKQSFNEQPPAFHFGGKMHPKQPPVPSFLSLSPTCISSVRWNAGRKLLSHPEVKWGALLFFYFKDDNQQEESNIEGPSCLGSVIFDYTDSSVIKYFGFHLWGNTKIIVQLFLCPGI